jgi:hypothetical protein
MLPTPDEYMNVHWGLAKAVDTEVDVNSYETGPYKVRKSYQYSISTKAGDCGAPMILLNSKLATRKIFGIHVAGLSGLGIGYAAAISQEDILEDLKLFKPQIISEPIIVDCEPEMGETFGDNRFRYLGTVDRSPSRSTVVDIVKSRIHGTYAEALTGPARLRPFIKDGEEVDPLAIAQRKFCTPDVFIENDTLSIIVDEYFSWYSAVSKKDVARRVFSIEEAIYGIENEDCFTSLASDTSAGYPMNLSKERNLKKELFTAEKYSEEWQEVMTEITFKVEAVIEKMRGGVRPVWLYTDNLKNERITLEKIDAGKARMFCGCPFILLVVTRMYFGAFTQHYMANRIENGSAIGVNPYSEEWDFLARKLSQFDITTPMVGAGDYSGFDASEKPQIHYLIGKGIDKWFRGNQEESLIREILFLEIYNSRHIIDYHVYEWDASLPSGSPLTSPVNTIYNHIAFRWCFYDCTGEIDTFNKNVYVIALGDDNVFAVSDRYREVFNEMTICASMAKIGLKNTIENKKDVDEKNIRT